MLFFFFYLVIYNFYILYLLKIEQNPKRVYTQPDLRQPKWNYN